MKKNWLRGLLLGVSLALLLAGGVALAQGITITTDPAGCYECWTDVSQWTELDVYTSGWADNETITWWAWKDGVLLGDPYRGSVQASEGAFSWRGFCTSLCPGVRSGADAQQILVCPFGHLKLRFTGATSGRSGEVEFRVAEDCEVEFVPEPGSMLLLGSGLAGLAGYAALRWRTRE